MTGINYYLAKDGESFGPYPEDQLQVMRIEGKITEGMHYLIEDFNRWIPIENLIPELDKYIDEDLESLKSGERHYNDGLEPSRQFGYPCWEFSNLYERNERIDWRERWECSGGRFYDGRMIALKTDYVWSMIGSSAHFSEGYGKPFPPFARASSMGVMEVDRDEAIALGIITDKFDPIPTELKIAMRANFMGTDEELDQLERELAEEAKRLLGEE